MGNKIKKIVVGVSTYGTLPRVDGFVKSFWQNLDPMAANISLVCCDDGTPNIQALRERRTFCQKSNCAFIEHGDNKGISAAWNTLASYDPEADLVLIFNDDIRFITPGWLTRIIHFFENNDQIGMVGLSLIHDDGYKDKEDRWWSPPGLVGAATGCDFAIRPNVLFSVENPDNSKGFWVDLVSFHEEIHLGFKLAEKGFLSYMLPFPPCYHQGGATFSMNDELVWRKPSEYLPMETFLKYVRQTKWYIPAYEEKYKTGVVDRMSYSRLMFSKYWGILDEVDQGNFIKEIKGEQVVILNEPQKPVHNRCVDVWPKRIIKWIDRDGKHCEGEIG